MPDREKVINGLRSIKTYLASQAIESTDDFAREGFIESQRDIDDAIYLLKEQEAVKPTIDEYGNKRCGSCGHKLQSIADPDLFCCKCGKPVLWEGR